MTIHRHSVALILVAILTSIFCRGVSAGPPAGMTFVDLDKLPARTGQWSKEEIAKGREQLVRAFDAAWIRVIASGKDQKILAAEPPTHPGAAQQYVVRMVDCLPQPHIAPWPEKPVGMFKDILATGVIRQLIQGVPLTPANTAWFFHSIGQQFQTAVLAEIENHYGVKLTVESVILPPGRLPATSVLVANKVDFVAQLNATGGKTQGLRRRISRRFSCTMTASSQYIHIPLKSPLTTQIKNLNDLIAQPQVRICAGPLTTQTARAYMPNHKIKTKYVDDLSGCDKAIKAGKHDIIINPLHDLGIAGIKGYKAIATQLVAGTPLWVASEGIECPSDGNPETEDHCFETDPP